VLLSDDDASIDPDQPRILDLLVSRPADPRGALGCDFGQPHPFAPDADCNPAFAAWDAAGLVNETPSSVENHGFSPVLSNSPRARIAVRALTL
jgi:hypothetical protein